MCTPREEWNLYAANGGKLLQPLYMNMIDYKTIDVAE